MLHRASESGATVGCKASARIRGRGGRTEGDGDKPGRCRWLIIGFELGWGGLGRRKP